MRRIASWGSGANWKGRKLTMDTPDPTAMPAPAREVRPRRDRTRPVVLTADMTVSEVVGSVFEELGENLHWQ